MTIKFILMICMMVAPGKAEVVFAKMYDTREQCEYYKKQPIIVDSYPKHQIMCVEIVCR